MIIWSGLGFLVAVITFVCMLVTELAVEGASADDRYFQSHGWPQLVGMLFAALLVGLLARALRARQTETRIDAATGNKVTVVAGQNHTLFFVPIRYWPPILVVLGILSSFTRE